MKSNKATLAGIEDGMRKVAFLEGGRTWPDKLDVKMKTKKKAKRPSSFTPALAPDSQVTGEQFHERK
jgi:hypothetical protein